MKKGRIEGDGREAREERRAGESSITMVGREVRTMVANKEAVPRPRPAPRPGPAPGTYRTWCSLCDKYLSGGPSRLQQHHDAVHLHLRPWECDHCGDMFGRKSDLERHITTVHLGLRLYPCTVEGCGKSFADASTLWDHGRAKHGHSLLFCIVCGATYAWTSNFNSHRRKQKA